LSADPDVHAARRTHLECDAELLEVPAGGTASFQPLDRRTLGERKSRAKAELGRRAMTRGVLDIDYSASLDAAIQLWNAVSPENAKRDLAVLNSAVHHYLSA
jgi:hypothetical protein